MKAVEKKPRPRGPRGTPGVLREAVEHDALVQLVTARNAMVCVTADLQRLGYASASKAAAIMASELTFCLSKLVSPGVDVSRLSEGDPMPRMRRLTAEDAA